MTTPNPLIPQGSLEAQQYQKRSATKVFVSAILAAHGVVLGGLLFLGCQKDEPENKVADNRGTFDALTFTTPTNTEAQSASPFGDLGLSTNEIEIPSLAPGAGSNVTTSGFPPFPGDTNAFTTTPGTNTHVPVETPEPLTVVPPPAAPVKYAVLPGDNFTTIARKHKITVKSITAANPGVDSRSLKVGQVLNLPEDVKPVAPAIPSDGPGSATAGETMHTVKSGDTLTKLARDYKVSVKAIQRVNNIRGSKIMVGQKLVIPAPEPGSSQ